MVPLPVNTLLPLAFMPSQHNQQQQHVAPNFSGEPAGCPHAPTYVESMMQLLAQQQQQAPQAQPSQSSLQNFLPRGPSSIVVAQEIQPLLAQQQKAHQPPLW